MRALYGCKFGVHLQPVHRTATDRVFARVKIATTRKMCTTVYCAVVVPCCFRLGAFFLFLSFVFVSIVQMDHVEL